MVVAKDGQSWLSVLGEAEAHGDADGITNYKASHYIILSYVF